MKIFDTGAAQRQEEKRGRASTLCLPYVPILAVPFGQRIKSAGYAAICVNGVRCLREPQRYYRQDQDEHPGRIDKQYNRVKTLSISDSLLECDCFYFIHSQLTEESE